MTPFKNMVRACSRCSAAELPQSITVGPQWDVALQRRVYLAMRKLRWRKVCYVVNFSGVGRTECTFRPNPKSLIAMRLFVVIRARAVPLVKPPNKNHRRRNSEPIWIPRSLIDILTRARRTLSAKRPLRFGDIVAMHLSQRAALVAPIRWNSESGQVNRTRVSFPVPLSTRFHTHGVRRRVFTFRVSLTKITNGRVAGIRSDETCDMKQNGAYSEKVVRDCRAFIIHPNECRRLLEALRKTGR
jgi:hypothetical protein